MQLDRCPRNLSWQRAGLYVTRSFKHHAVDRPIWLVYHNLEGGHPDFGEGPTTFLPVPPTSREDLRLDGYLEYPHAAKALYIYKHSCLLRYSKPGPTAPHKLLQTEDNDLPSAMEFLKNRKDFFKDLKLDTALNEMLCDAREFPDEIDIPANFELTQPHHRVRRRNAIISSCGN
ncbi:uncharacterized protein TNCV_2074281 [Trichonephila clavipes]|nr:uncharacterized protein TNCV_2074281 [Trichonephila clavipes]